MTFTRRVIAAACAAGAFATVADAAWADADVEALREEFDQKLKALQQNYEMRLRELEGRRKPDAAAPGAAGSEVGPGTAAAAAPKAAPEAASQTAAPVQSEPRVGSASRSNFNPDLSLVLQGRYLRSRDIDERRITGFIPGADDHGAGRGFNLGHTEFIASGSIDPYFRGLMNLAVAPEGGAEVEEAWVQTQGLGNGITVKAGRYLSGIGYVNEQHPHAWDFSDQNLMYQALFGEHLTQDGVQLKWLAPTETFLEFGAEGGRGQVFPGSEAGADRNAPGAWAAFVKLGGDVGSSHSWRAGLNYLGARPIARQAHLQDIAGVDAETAFTGDSRTWLVDLVWKWAPQGDGTRRNAKLQAEYFRRTETGELACADNTASAGACTGVADAYRSKQTGWYAQGVYQFMPRWRVGYRYDRLDPGSVLFGDVPLEAASYRPSRHTLMTDYAFSEFSLFRLQFARDRSQQGIADNQVTLQYIHSLGAHGAHRF